MPDMNEFLCIAFTQVWLTMIKPMTGLQQFFENLWSGSAITAAWSDVGLSFTEEERLPISTEQKTAAAASLLWQSVSKNGLFLCGMCVHAVVHVQGHQNKKTALCVRTSPRFGAYVFTMKTNENQSKCDFHFVTLKENVKNCHSETSSSVWLLENIFKAEQSILVFTDSFSLTNIH